MKRFLAAALCTLALTSAAAPDSQWTISTSDYDAPEYYGVAVANGGIGFIPWREPFSIKDVTLNSVFDADSRHGISRLMKGINPFTLCLSVDGTPVDSAASISKWNQSLDMHEAVHTTSFRLDGKADVSYSMRALRNMPYAGLITVSVKALEPVEVKAANSAVLPEGYYGAPEHNVSRMTIVGKEAAIARTSASGLYRGTVVSASSAFMADSCATVACHDDTLALTASLRRGQTLRFALIGSVVSDRDFIDPWNESDRQVVYAIQEGLPRLLDAHSRQWHDLWQGDIIIDGDPETQQAIRLSLYHLYSSARKGSRLSIPPFGMTDQKYNGHIFWDTETWMYPAMLFLNTGIARSMIDYRTDRLDAACRRALAYGYDGAMFPWESDDAGEEACPTWALTGAFEHHITADIAIAAWNYYRMTRDLRWLREEGYPLIEKVAEFWTSRVDRNDDGSYSIRNVVCADEYAEGVDDNAFTNAATICALNAAVSAAKECGLTPPDKWSEIAAGLRILRSPDGVTLEHEGYDGRIIKQADVNLLGYPLNLITDPDQLRRDLEYYEPRIDNGGPAMSMAVLAAQHSRLGDGEKAYELFVRSFSPNRLPPFGVIAEVVPFRNPYFVTGAGGFVQAVVNGFCGLDITDQGIVQRPSAIPARWKKLTVTGVGPDRLTFTRTH